jgi:hypothetical protein
MKHNEIKAFIKKEIKARAQNIGWNALSVDSTNSTRTIYIIDPSSMQTKIRVKVFCNDTEFSVTLDIPNYELSPLTIGGSYTSFGKFAEVLLHLDRLLGVLN